MKGRFTGRPASAFKLALLCGVGGGGLALLLGWDLRIPLGLAGFFLVVAAIELLSVPRTKRGPSPPPASAGSSAVAPFAAGEFGAYSYRGGERTCFGTVVPLGRGNVQIDLRQDELLEARIRVVRDLVGRTDELARAFEAFKRQEGVRQPRWAEEILGLEIELITFHDKQKPDAGEVYFTLESGRDQWFCTFVEGKFADLSQES